MFSKVTLWSWNIKNIMKYQLYTNASKNNRWLLVVISECWVECCNFPNLYERYVLRYEFIKWHVWFTTVPHKALSHQWSNMQYIYIYVTHLLLQNNGEFNAIKTIFHIIDEIKVSRAYRYMIRAYIKLQWKYLL